MDWSLGGIFMQNSTGLGSHGGVFKQEQRSWCYAVLLRGAWSDRDTNDIFAHCSLIFYYLDFKFSNFVCPSELHPLIWFFLKNSFRKNEKYPKNLPKRLSS